ncbi:hypothetical protein ACIBQ6_13960 [Nonomuraea sp. NPDC049655]
MTPGCPNAAVPLHHNGLTYRGLSAAVMNAALDRETDPVANWHAQMFEVGAALPARAR